MLNFINKLLGFFKPVVLSYSRISVYTFCPWKYKLIYRDNWKTPPNPSVSLGLTIHEVLEKYQQRRFNTLEELFSLYDELWINLGFLDAAETIEFYENGKKMLEDFYLWELTRRKNGIITQFVEKEIEFNIGRVKIKGTIDRVDKYPDGSYEIIDYKTHKDEWDENQLDRDIQLTIYSIGCQRVFGIKPSKVSYYFLSQNRYVSVNKTQLHEQLLKDVINTIADKISKVEFTPNLSNCPKCDFSKKCPRSSKRPVKNN